MIRVVLLGLALFIAFPAALSAAPKSELWMPWLVNDPDSRAVIDHRPWDDFLQSFRKDVSDGVARLDYGAVMPDELAALNAYLDRLSAVTVTGLNRAEQFAYWVNLYNALTVRLVLEHYPVKSIKDIGLVPAWLGGGPWKQKLITVEDTALTLDDIEHRILRPIWRDPRIHYVVNCASIGCPNLPARALTAGNMESVLEESARRFINHPRGVTVMNGTLTASSLFVWFKEDFGRSDQDVIDHLRAFAGPLLRQELAGIETIQNHAYDWNLNDVPPALSPSGADDQSKASSSGLRFQ